MVEVVVNAKVWLAHVTGCVVITIVAATWAGLANKIFVAVVADVAVNLAFHELIVVEKVCGASRVANAFVIVLCRVCTRQAAT